MKSNTIILIVITLVIAAGAFWYFGGQQGTEAPLTEAIPALDNPAESQFQVLVSQLQPISFNMEIFSDPRFTALVDLTTPITPESSGRVDPFAAISGAGASAAPSNG